MPAGGPGNGAGFAGAAGAGQPGQGQAPSFPEGTAEHAAQKVIMQLLAGDQSGLSDFISPKLKGVMGDIRDGKATPAQIDELKKTFQNPTLVGKPRKEGSATAFTLRNGEGATITLRVKKEGDTFRLSEYTVKAAPKKSR